MGLQVLCFKKIWKKIIKCKENDIFNIRPRFGMHTILNTNLLMEDYIFTLHDLKTEGKHPQNGGNEKYLNLD